jgi:hypothetical protein
LIEGQTNRDARAVSSSVPAAACGARCRRGRKSHSKVRGHIDQDVQYVHAISPQRAPCDYGLAMVVEGRRGQEREGLFALSRRLQLGSFQVSSVNAPRRYIFHLR